MGARSPEIRELQVPGSVLRRLAARFPDRYPALFDSSAEGPLAQASILAAEPGACLWRDAAGRIGSAGLALKETQFLDALERWWQSERCPSEAWELPFVGGWIVFLGYEVAAEIEPRLVLPPASLPWSAFALRTPCAFVHERSSDRVFAVAEAEAADCLPQMLADAYAMAAAPLTATAPLSVAAIHEEAPALYLERVRRAQDYIAAGDIYQANLSRPWRIELAADAPIASLYERLCRANPAPFAALAQWRGMSILSSSPERLVRIRGAAIDTRPIAGTRPRSRSPGGDQAETRGLAAHPKERAEHVMLVDLERNDLGRVCMPGSVRVDELMSIESYAHVHHIVSNVSGRLRPEVSPIGALRAVFPGGTITGCPKFRCMQIIAELEATGRGAYTGSLGFLGRDGRMDLNILIRTMTVTGRRIELRAGGGIVADSDPERELEETRAKARGLLAAFGEPPTAGPR